MTKWTLGLVATGLGWGLLAGTTMAQQAGQAEPAKASNLPTPMGALRDLQGVGQMLFKLADANNDGQISQKEALDSANLLIGGFFFRADTNGDGTISPEEARAARDALFQKRPWLRYVVERSRTSPGQNANAQQNPMRNLMSMLDTNQDRNLQATEVRQLVQSTVQTMFASADTDRNGQLSPAEVNAAMASMVRTASQAAFQAADKDRNGQLSREEFLQMLTGPAESAFAVLDANGDGQLSPQELQQAQRVIAAELRALRVPEQPNSPANVIESGLRAPQGAPAAPAPATIAPAAPARAPATIAPAVPAPAPTTPR